MQRLVCSGEINLTDITCSTGWEVETVLVNSLELLDPIVLGQMLSLGFGVTFTVLLAMHPIVHAIKTILDILRHGERQND